MGRSIPEFFWKTQIVEVFFELREFFPPRMRRRESIERWTSTYFRKMTFLKNIVFFWVGFQGEKPGIFYSGGYQVPNFSGTGTLLAGFTGMGDFLTEKSEFMLERQWKKFPATSSVDLYPSNKHTGIPF